jgi:hypothetical protein
VVVLKGTDSSVPQVPHPQTGPLAPEGKVRPQGNRNERINVTFISVLEAIGKGFEKGLQWAVTYAIPAEKLVATLFPAAAPVATGIADAVSLVQTAVLLVEQKYAAAGVQSSSGPQKLAEVMLLAEPAVTQLLTQAGVAASTSYIQSLVSAVVAILNVQTMPAAPKTA